MKKQNKHKRKEEAKEKRKWIDRYPEKAKERLSSEVGDGDLFNEPAAVFFYTAKKLRLMEPCSGPLGEVGGL